ncbi:hypothetical protein BCEN4_740106 [Burkholderia cenocepacia]|uniref:hypothetical protein n=1 Tax=Burkholderia cenocepacia TaxID=95486 RepID=UPI00192AABD7|nr:hypothetical protein [Burkholderia cenocepacia]CAD9227989.1 hypothetical protein BCEN4_740106 [Burkholderia cenocepacia]
MKHNENDTALDMQPEEFDFFKDLAKERRDKELEKQNNDEDLNKVLLSPFKNLAENIGDLKEVFGFLFFLASPFIFIYLSTILVAMLFLGPIVNNIAALDLQKANELQSTCIMKILKMEKCGADISKAMTETHYLDKYLEGVSESTKKQALEELRKMEAQ